MFPLVSPYGLSSRNSAPAPSGSIASYVTGSSKLLVPGRVTASTSIAQGAMTIAIEPAHLLGHPDVQQISVLTNSFGTIELEEKSQTVWCKSTHWVRALRLSDDCHSYNIQLRLQPSQRPCNNNLNKNNPVSKLILQAVRPIEAGQELLLWFSEDILAMLQIVFLTPANIQGQKKYVCTRCSALYESPNPLKLHITLCCGKFTITSLWEKLSNMMRENSLENILKQESFEFTLTQEPQLFRQKNAMDLSMSNGAARPESTSKNLYRPYHTESSAFKPFKKCDAISTLGDIPAMWPIATDKELHMQNHLNNAANYNDEAQIECLVSSLGKSKQGHICLYCGKCYSRRYGLKIHIRTHTGYKPLKCKFCLRPFGDPSNLNKHVRLHAEGNTPYKCDLCGKILVRRRDLERHLKSRHLIEMHPSVDILPSSGNEDVDVSDEDSEKTSAV